MDNIRSVMSGSLSRSSAFNLTVNGDWGTREIRNLIRQLEMQHEWLTEDQKSALAPQNIHERERK